MNLLRWIVLGALAGFLAGLLLGETRRRFWPLLGVGILGAALGGLTAKGLGLGGITGLNLYSLLIAVGGACLLLLIFRLLRRFF